MVEKNQTGEIDDLEFLLAQEDLAALYVANTAHTESLTVLYGSNEIACFEQAVHHVEFGWKGKHAGVLSAY